VKERTEYILRTTQVLKTKLGAFVVQLPASFKPDHEKVDRFLTYFTEVARAQEHPPDIAIEFRHKGWFTDETYKLLRSHNVALVAAQSSRYPESREGTADFLYLRLHGPEQLFASSYTKEQLTDWAKFIKSAGKGKRAYVYFNNDIGGHALRNARELKELM